MFRREKPPNPLLKWYTPPHLLTKLKHFGDRAKIEIEAVTTAFGEIEAFDRHRHRFHAFPYLRLCVFRREKKLHSLVAWEQLLDRKTHFFQKERQFSCLVILDVSGFVSLGECAEGKKGSEGESFRFPKISEQKPAARREHAIYFLHGLLFDLGRQVMEHQGTHHEIKGGGWKR